MKKIFNKLKHFWDIILELLSDIWFIISFTIKRNMYIFGKMLEISIPYIMWYLTVSLYKERGYFTIGGELFIPILLLFICGVIKKASDESGQGYKIPVAKKRFTTEDDFGEVSISENDLQEIILYLNDVENYIEKRGLNKWGS